MLRVIVLLFVLTACSDGNGDFFSGHQIGMSRSGQIIDIGDYRIEVADMRTVRNFPIPETRYISFSWSPSGYQRIFNQNRWKLPTDDDWQNFQQLLLQTKDWSRYGNPTKAQSALIDYLRDLKVEHDRSDYKMRVREDGFIFRDLCSGYVSGRPACAQDLTIQNDEKMRLAQYALDRFDPGCTLGEVDPQAATTLFPNYRSGALSLVIEVNCGRKTH